MSRTRGIDPSKLESRIVDVLGVPAAEPWFVAYSGGVDSTVLLHLLRRICRAAGTPLVALHADHQLHPESQAWRRRCERQCRDWELDCRAAALDCGPAAGAGLGPEGRARAARYRWFAEIVGGTGWLFTAHHRDDQAETLIERLSRASGPGGLRGMQPVSRVYGVNVVRPLLDLPRAAILDYAGQHRLSWIHDDANDDSGFTRNYIRSRVLPVLRARWPAIDASLARTAAAMHDARQILDDAAAGDLAGLAPRTDRGDPSIDLAALRALTPARQRNVLRHWLRAEAGAVPGHRRLERLLRAVAAGAAGGLQWPPVDLRLYRGRLYLVRPREAPAAAGAWDAAEPLALGGGMVLHAKRVAGRGLRADGLRHGVTVTFRRGGEKCRLPGRRHRHSLKNVLHDAGVPPWQRPRVPLICIDNEIAAVVGVAYCDPYTAVSNENGVEFDLTYD